MSDSTYSPLACSTFWSAGWWRANRVPSGYTRYGQHAYERLYGRWRRALKRELALLQNGSTRRQSEERVSA